MSKLDKILKITKDDKAVQTDDEPLFHISPDSHMFGSQSGYGDADNNIFNTHQMSHIPFDGNASLNSHSANFNSSVTLG